MSAPEARVLIVDDEAGVARLCERVLEGAGFEVEAFTKPERGIEHLRRHKVDLLLVDIRMPEMDGFQLMTAARRHQPDLAVVIMTGFGTVETAIEALRQGADGLILKPFSDNKELVRSIRDALQESHDKREVARLLALRPLFNITEALFSETRPDRLLDLILRAICGHLRCDHAGYYRRQPGEERLTLVASQGNPPREAEDDAETDPIARVEELGVSLAAHLEGPGEAQWQEYLRRHDLGSILCAPVSRDGEGSVLLAGRKAGDPIFSEADSEMFGILARQAAVALENAHLYAELRDYVRQVEESQQALIQAEKMAAVGRLMASIAHEINNPLQAVRNCLHLANRAELPPEKRQEYLTLAENELKRLMSTVQRMLDFSRPSSLDRKPADVNELIGRVLQLLEKQLEERNIRVSAKLSKKLPKIYVVDNQIQQVFFNLILNAMDAMPSGGQLFVETSLENRLVEVIFEDTGPGVPAEVRDHIFEPFTSTKERGTGLGLSVSYSILDAHDGNLELVAGKKRGACFRVTLPVREAS